MSTDFSTPSPGDEVLIVGGGIVGLSVAWELAGRGVRPMVVDPSPIPGQTPGQATWAAGGMLAPLGEARAPGPFLELALKSLQLYPDFVRGIEAESGESVGLDLSGKVLAALSAQDEDRIRDRERWLSANGHPVRWLSAAELRSQIPDVATRVRGGLLLEGNGRVNNRALLSALYSACESKGVGFMAGRVKTFRVAEGALEAALLDDGRQISCAHAVLAAGAWAEDVDTGPGIPRSRLPGVRPVKGQMLAYLTPDRPLSMVVTTPRVYLIPRETPAGPVVVAGATEEDSGFDTGLTAASQAALEEGATELLPSLAFAQVVERWSGFRPDTPDHLPVLGPHPDVRGVTYATGHFRNGILLAPVTARMVADVVMGKATPTYADDSSLEAFSPLRLVT